MKTCPDCGHENDDSHLFCAKCGRKLDDTEQTESSDKQEEKIEEEPVLSQSMPTQPLINNEKMRYCPNCGKQVEKNEQSCSYCGEKLFSNTPKPIIIPTEANFAVLISIVGLVYSICGAFTLTGVVLGIIAIYFGSKANDTIKKETIYGGRDRAIAGIVLGSIAIALNVIFLIAWFIMFSLGMFSDLFNESMFL